MQVYEDRVANNVSWVLELFKKKYYDHQFQISGLPFSKVKLGNKELFGHPTIVQ